MILTIYSNFKILGKFPGMTTQGKRGVEMGDTFFHYIFSQIFFLIIIIVVSSIALLQSCALIELLLNKRSPTLQWSIRISQTHGSSETQMMLGILPIT